MKENTLLIIEDNCVINCDCDIEGRIVIPHGITGIADKAFMFCTKLKEVHFPETLQSIGMAAFHGCGLETLTIPNDCTYIAESAFSCCVHLKDVTLAKELELICGGLFCGCNHLESITIPDSVRIIRETAFAV